MQSSLSTWAEAAETKSFTAPSGASLLEEPSLFAAEGSFAYRRGGPVARRFFEHLPSEWKTGHLVVDSILVWLQSGQSLQTRWFHHEVYPGRTQLAFGDANRERDVEHIACAFGAPSAREFLVGDMSSIERPNLGFHLYGANPEHFPARHRYLSGQAEDRVLRTVRFEVNTGFRYSFGVFQRALPTETPGYHFWIRASYRSCRPIVNGLRNVSSPSHSGPWLAK